MSYETNIDRATVLPSSEGVLQHFSNQLLQKDQIRYAREQADKERELQRQIQLQKYIGDSLDPKSFDPSQTKDVEAALSTMVEAQKSGQGIPQLMGLADNLSSQLKMANNKIKQGQQVAAAQVAAYMKKDPYADMQAVNNATIKKMMVDNKWDIDPTVDYADEAAKELNTGGLLYSPQARQKAKDDFREVLFDPKRLTKFDENPEYDEKGNLTRAGVEAKINPVVVDFEKDKDGRVVYDKFGRTNYGVKSKNYQIDGKDLLDNEGKPVKVASDELFSFYKNNPALAADIEDEIRKKGIPANSITADVERQRMFYDFLNDETKGRYEVITPKNESAERKSKIQAQNLAKAQFAETKRMHDFSIKKYNQENATNVRDLIGEYVSKSAKKVSVPSLDGGLSLQELTVIENSDIDAGDREKYFGGVSPIEFDGKEYWLVNDNGDLVGEGNQIVNRQAVTERLADDTKKDTKKAVPVGKRNILKKAADRIKQAITPKTITPPVNMK